MFEWEGRILDNKSIQAVKAALPYLDLPVGSIIDIEGLLRAVRNFCRKREQRMIDMILNFLMMKRVMSMLTVMNQMNEGSNGGSGMDGMMELLKSQMPKEQQDMFDMMSVMMSSMAEDTAENNGEEQNDDGSGGHFQEYASGEGSGYPGAGGEGEWQPEGYEEPGAADYGSDAEAEGTQPFVFPAGGFGPFRNLDKGHESGGEAEGGDDETGRTQSIE